MTLHTSGNDNADDFARARLLFPVLDNLTYLSICDKSLLPRPARAAAEQYLDKMETAGATRAQHEKQVRSACEKFARLINADADEIAFVRNVSDGINTIVWAIDWRPGDHVIITADLEHPNNLYPWRRLERLGVILKIIPARHGAVHTESMIEAMDDRTRAVTVASVTFSPGLRTDLAAIGKAARARNALFVVDAVQSAGILAHDARAEWIDCLATSTSKGLLGLYGAGFLYVRREVADRLEPAYLSRSGVDADPDQHSEGGLEPYRLAPGARRFEVGSFPLGAAYAVDASLDIILGLGAPAIERYVLTLSEALANGLRERGLPVSEAAAPSQRSHIVTLGILGDGGHDYTNDAHLNALAEHLRRNSVVFTIRRGQLRFALHFYNNHSDVSRVLSLVDEHLATSLL